MPKTNTNPSRKLPEPQEAKTLILSSIRKELEAWRKFLGELTPEQAARPVDGPWSAIDALVHITAWMELSLKIANLQARSDEPDPGPNSGAAVYLHIDIDQFNAEVFESHQGWSQEQTIAWNTQVTDDLLAALAQLPIERLLNGAGRYGARMWYWRVVFIHSREHRRQVRRLLLGKSE